MGTRDSGPDDARRAAFLDDPDSRAADALPKLLGRGASAAVGAIRRCCTPDAPPATSVRGWLDYGLRRYSRMMALRPDWFDDMA